MIANSGMELLRSAIANPVPLFGLEPEKSNEIYFSQDPAVTGPSEVKLITHIAGAHLKPEFLLDGFGVPRFDLELACVRQIHLEGVVEEAYKIIEMPKDVLKSHLRGGWDDFDMVPYKGYLAKTLLYVAILDLGVVDWGRVGRSFSSLESLDLNLETDSKEKGHPAYRKKRMNHYRRYVLNKAKFRESVGL